MLKPLAPCGFLCTCYSFIICLVISFVNIDKSHFISTNYSFAALFDADRRKIIKASYFYAHLINAQKRTAYAERVENQKKDTIGKILSLGDFCNGNGQTSAFPVIQRKTGHCKAFFVQQTGKAAQICNTQRRISLFQKQCIKSCKGG